MYNSYNNRNREDLGKKPKNYYSYRDRMELEIGEILEIDIENTEETERIKVYKKLKKFIKENFVDEYEYEERLYSNEVAIEILKKIADETKEIQNEVEGEIYGEYYTYILDNILISRNDLYCYLRDFYDDFEEGDEGNNYFITGSNTCKVCFMYGKNDDGKNVTIRYIMNDILNLGSIVIYAEEI